MKSRIFGTILACIVLIGLGSYGVMFVLGMRRYVTAPARLEQRTAEAADVVPAIFLYRQQLGVWPATIESLIPKYLAQPLPADWVYSISDFEGIYPPRLKLSGEAHTRLYFDFPDDPCSHVAEWILSDEGNQRKIPFAHPLPPCSELQGKAKDQIGTR